MVLARDLDLDLAVAVALNLAVATGRGCARPWPPGRGSLVSGRTRPQLVQCCLIEDEQPSGPAAGFLGTGLTAGTSR